jgi:hypothetical protein
MCTATLKQFSKRFARLFELCKSDIAKRQIKIIPPMSIKILILFTLLQQLPTAKSIEAIYAMLSPHQ